MDSIFLLNDGDRATFLQHIMHSFGFTYTCLWSYFPQPSNCLLFMDGLYNEESNQQSSSSTGSIAGRRFHEYRQSIFAVHNGRVPGHAFKNSLPFVGLKELDLPRLASNESQLQFYQEARIKTAIFMGCKTGEIELGMANDTQVNLEMEMRNLFPNDFSRQVLPRELLQPTDQSRPSSSSSSLRSLSMDSPECSPFLFNISSASYVPEPRKEEPLEQALRPISSTTCTTPFQQAIQSLSHIRNVQFPTIESEDAALTKAILAVISSSSPSSSSSSHHPQQNLLPPNYQTSQKASAFKSYRSALAPKNQLTARVQRQTIWKRSITFFSCLNQMRTQGQIQGTRPTSTQLHHMISERRRREKLNESFQALRSLLPLGSKRDKASVLASTTEYLTSLKTQVEELSRRNQILEVQLPKKEVVDEEGSGSSNERLDVRITNIAESTSEARIVGLQVSVRGECSMVELVIRILEFLKQVKNVSLMSVEAKTRMVGTSSRNQVILRLKTEGGEWDESAFQEAVRRVVDDLAQ